MTDKAGAEAMRDQQVTFWRKVGHMIGSGVPIVETFEVIAEEMADTPMSGPAKEIATALGQHEAMYKVLERYPAVFPRSVVDLVRSGEAGGDLHKKALLIAEGIEQGVFPTGGSASEDASLRAAAAPVGEAGAEVHQGRQLADDLVLEAIHQRASDIHLEAVRSSDGKDGLVFRARFRVDGVLATHRTFSADEYASVVSRVKFMADLDVSDEARRQPQDGRILLRVKGRDLDLRVSAAPARFGEMVTIRVLDRQAIEFHLDRLGLSEQNRGAVEAVLRRPNGLFIVAGPAGSGKTTVLYTLLSSLDAERKKICAAEDPVEYDLPGVLQLQLDPQHGLTFPRLVRTFLRSDPDVIMIGELRDQESAWMAHAAALTGHLVLTTLHTGDAPTTLRRLVDIGVHQWLVADAVIGVLACRLVRILCESCRKQSQSAVPELQGMALPPELTSALYYEPVGCEACRGTGYRGRTGVHELLLMSDAFRQAFVRETDLTRTRELALTHGMVPMLVDALQKARAGQTSVAEVMRVVLLGV